MQWMKKITGTVHFCSLYAFDTLFPGCMCILWCSYLIFRVVTSLFLQFFIYPGHTLSHSYLAGFLTLVF